jgi:hypothetical protein
MNTQKTKRDVSKGAKLVCELVAKDLTIAAIRERLEALADEDEWDDDSRKAFFDALPETIETVRDKLPGAIEQYELERKVDEAAIRIGRVLKNSFYVVVGVLAVFLALTRPDEEKLRASVFGESGRSVEHTSDLSALLGGPKISYRNYFFASALVLEFNRNKKQLLAFGIGGHVSIPDDIKKVQPPGSLFSR